MGQFLLRLLSGIFVIFCSINLHAEEPQYRVLKNFTCSGVVGSYRTGIADSSIGGGDSMCYFVSESGEGKRILDACPRGANCEVVGTVKSDNNGGDWSPTIIAVNTVTLVKNLSPFRSPKQ